jgi:hypothetical protein
MIRLSRVVPATALALSLVFGLGACAATGTQLGADLHTSVVEISDRVNAGDFAGALAELALLDRDVSAASEDGRLDADREREIRAAMELVRADLEAAEVASTPSPTATPAPTAVTVPEDDSGPGNSDDKGNDDKGKGDEKGKGGD